MAKLIIFNKPFQVLSQFTDKEDRTTLAAFITEKNVYTIGRLDYDSEGLLLLTDSGALNHQIAHPSSKKHKTYWVQVEGEISNQAIQRLCEGVQLNDGPTLPAKVKKITPPTVWDRTPPVRIRKQIPTSWIEIKIIEGRNRQVRRMTANVGFPTLRLIRASVADWQLEDLKPGQYKTLEVNLPNSNTKSIRKKRSFSPNNRKPPKQDRSK